MSAQLRAPEGRGGWVGGRRCIAAHLSGGQSPRLPRRLALASAGPSPAPLLARRHCHPRGAVRPTACAPSPQASRRSTAWTWASSASAPTRVRGRHGRCHGRGDVGSSLPFCSQAAAAAHMRTRAAAAALHPPIPQLPCSPPCTPTPPPPLPSPPCRYSCGLHHCLPHGGLPGHPLPQVLVPGLRRTPQPAPARQAREEDGAAPAAAAQRRRRREGRPPPAWPELPPRPPINISKRITILWGNQGEVV